MNMTITLFDSIINTSQDCVFWKDKNRRFMGVNQAFLDFYGFGSEDILIGKTDEDMGWHNDPEPYRQDELRVLSGESTYKVQGKCMAQGEERDIVASKRPLYENGEIVGLVGSFMDITELVRRQKRIDGQQIMYTVEELRKYDFWDRILDDTPLDEILDPLTGVIKRNYMTDFANYLISKKKPFSLSILDLDNFKFINDQYGHHSGDLVLKAVTGALADYTRGYSLAGRFGGDELLLINLRDTMREENQVFWDGLYASHSIFRRNIEIDKGSTFVTGTCGSASFPSDQKNLSQLFVLIDKALYIGKGRGRNCFIIYDAEKHRDIDIKKLAKHNMSTDMAYLRKTMEEAADPMDGLRSVMPLLKEVLRIDDLYYINEQAELRAVLDNSLKEDAADAAASITDEFITCQSLYDIEDVSPIFSGSLRKLGIYSFIAARTFRDKGKTGYLICATKRKHRIWQENECAFIIFLAMLTEYGAASGLSE
ncbi:MAG: GGDEF domain-containing protein [Lachnospiraceae bacterium]|nr:GGDEF domain-containing protein [Lachnospiraceae bacterium]